MRNRVAPINQHTVIKFMLNIINIHNTYLYTTLRAYISVKNMNAVYRRAGEIQNLQFSKQHKI